MASKMNRTQKESYIIGQMSVEMAQLKGEEYSVKLNCLLSKSQNTREAAIAIHSNLCNFQNKDRIDIESFISGVEFALNRKNKALLRKKPCPS